MVTFWTRLFRHRLDSVDEDGRADRHGLHDPPSVGHCQSDAAVGARADAQHIGLLLDVAAPKISGNRSAISQMLWIPFNIRYKFHIRCFGEASIRHLTQTTAGRLICIGANKLIINDKVIAWIRHCLRFRKTQIICILYMRLKNIRTKDP